MNRTVIQPPTCPVPDARLDTPAIRAAGELLHELRDGPPNVVALLVGHDAPAGRVTHPDVDVRAWVVKGPRPPPISAGVGVVILIKNELLPKLVVEPRIDGAHVKLARRRHDHGRRARRDRAVPATRPPSRT